MELSYPVYFDAPRNENPSPCAQGDSSPWQGEGGGLGEGKGRGRGEGVRFALEGGAAFGAEDVAGADLGVADGAAVVVGDAGGGATGQRLVASPLDDDAEGAGALQADHIVSSLAEE